ncbi:hypothetical protein BHE74_00057641 [Ensete ventricosum]|nr:hypothetical protein BHE74_00057641 [Ensete ventricosum]
MRTLGTGIVLYRDKLGMPVQIGTANLGSYLVVDMAMNVRKQLGESLPGTGGGRNPHDQLLVKMLCSQRSASSCDVVACFYWLGMAVLAIVAPSLPCLLGITALFTSCFCDICLGASSRESLSERLRRSSSTKIGYEDTQVKLGCRAFMPCGDMDGCSLADSLLLL